MMEERSLVWRNVNGKWKRSEEEDEEIKKKIDRKKKMERTKIERACERGYKAIAINQLHTQIFIIN